MKTLFNHKDSSSGTPTLERIFEGPSDEQMKDYIKSHKGLTDGRSSIITNSDTKLLNYLETRYQIETNNPIFDIRLEIDKLIKRQNHGRKQTILRRLR